MSEFKQIQVVQKQVDDFHLHELVFVKMKGSPSWPSRIIGIDVDHLQVYFLGDNGRVYVVF